MKRNFKYLILFVCVVFVKNNVKAQVWPADANNNGIVNNVDFIFTGVALETGGPSRLGVDQGVDWNQKPAADWVNSFTSIGVNYKHADANGDGWIDGGDLFSVNDYYDTTNVNFTGLMGNVITGNDLYLTFSDTVIEAGDTITIKINLGTAANPISNIHGIAFSIGFDTSKIKEYETTIDFHGGWLGTPNVDLYTLAKYDASIDIERVDFSATRGPFGVMSGHGEIGTIVVITEDILAGKMQDIISAINFNFSNVIGIDSLANDMNISSKNDSIKVSDGVNSINKYFIEDLVIIYPNPTKNKFKILSEEAILNIELFDLLGKKLEVLFDDDIVSTTTLESGIYTVFIKTKKGISQKRIIIEK